MFRFAHGVHVSSTEIQRLQRRVPALPTAPEQHAAGLRIAPVRAYLDREVPVGIGVDGSANDSSHLLAEARETMLLQRVTGTGSPYRRWCAFDGNAR